MLTQTIWKQSASENIQAGPDGLTDKVHWQKPLTLSSFASISTTSVSTSSIFALKTKIREVVSARVVMCYCMYKKFHDGRLSHWKTAVLQSACDFPRSQRARGTSINLRVTGGVLRSETQTCTSGSGRGFGCALSERDAVLGAVQLCQNTVTDEVSTQRGEHGRLAHPKPQSTDPLSTPPPLMPHPTAPLREVWFTPGGSQLHDVAPKYTTPQLLHTLMSIRSMCIMNRSIFTALICWFLAAAIICFLLHSGTSGV